MKKWMRIAIGVIAILACTQIGIFAVQNHRNQKREESETTVQSAGTETQEKDTAEKNTVDSEAAKQEKSNSGIIVKSNVKVITKDTEYEEQPFEISDHSMKFEKDPGYQEGDVIVAGKTARVSDGLIRKVVQVKKATDGYWVETEDASLADVFEKVHVLYIPRRASANQKTYLKRKMDRTASMHFRHLLRRRVTLSATGERQPGTVDWIFSLT